ncbi:MAG: hypothetical protein RMJ54_18000 [Roseiflexaceae bacterium]|nr:hypothetical protein [Roseiflexaceae bacterium]
MGLLTGSYVAVRHGDAPSLMASDLTWVLRGANALQQGQNPYTVPVSPLPYWNDQPLFYPLPALLIVSPLAQLPDYLAAGVFFGSASALLTFVLIAYKPILLPLLLSATYSYALLQVQWAPLLLSCAFLPGLSILLLCKPNVGLPLLVIHRDKRIWLVIAGVLIGTLLILPSWPIDMLANTSAHHNFIPVLTGLGWLLVPALLRWRDSTYWPFLIFMFMPQRSFYDQLPIWLVCRTWKEALLLTAGSWIAFFGWPLFQITRDEAVVICLYLPAMVIMMRPSLAAAYASYRTHSFTTCASVYERFVWLWTYVVAGVSTAVPSTIRAYGKALLEKTRINAD